jgi:threonine dehydrogenase-like Zn-dependent dehydrogenase
MNLAASWTHDVLDADSANQQGIGDERTMTAPRHRFSTHQDDSALVRQADQFFEALRKLGRLHVIGVTSKGGISPAHVVRIALRMTQAAESRQVNVSQSGFL